MSKPRTIKKYPNRRLYDTEISKYITLSDVQQLVLDHVNFEVLDVKTQESITRSILLQIIIEQEERGEPILSAQVLTQLIRFYGDTMQGMIGRYLEQSLGLFIDQQASLQGNLRTVVGKDPINAMADITQRNLNAWRDMQEDFFKSFGVARVGEKKKNEDGPR